jgi:hypothetical protein
MRRKTTIHNEVFSYNEFFAESDTMNAKCGGLFFGPHDSLPKTVIRFQLRTFNT